LGFYFYKWNWLMIEKEYYRFDELEKRFDLSFSDLQYLVENSKIDLAFHIEQNQFVMGGWLKKKGFIGYSTIFYKGLVKVNHSEQLTLLAKNKVISKTFSLLNKKNIINHDLEYPFETQPPHSFLFDWRPKVITDIEWDFVPAKLFPKEREHSIRSLRNTFMSTLDTLKVEVPKQADKESDFMAKIPQVEFYAEGIKFTLNDICILHNDLVKLEVIKQVKEIKTHQENDIQLVKINSDSPKIPRKDDFHELFVNIVTHKPEYTAKEYWRLLESESEEMEGFRALDNYNLLIEITGNYIKWQDRSGKPRKDISFTAFSNRLSKVRKEVFVNNEN
jgi:hypothetical protein